MFCKEYIVDLNATQAAIRAGYSKKTAKDIACENLAKPYLQEEIQRLMAKRADKVDIKAQDVLKSIIDIRDRCMQSEPVYERLGGEMEKTGEYKFDATNALKANDMLMRHLGEYTDKVEMEIKEIPKIIIKRGKDD